VPVDIIQPGKSSANPFTICLIANPAFEAPQGSGSYQTDPVLAAPAAFADGLRMVADAIGEFEEERESSLRDGIGAVGGNIRDDDAALLRALNIDNVETGRCDADVFQAGQAVHHLGGDGDFVRESGIGGMEAADDFGGRGAFENLAFAQRAQSVPGQISRIQRVSIQHDNLHRARA